MHHSEKLDTHRKALSLNLDPSTFGSFAEIGAGQEVARWFLVVGGASGTVAKTISAYDKEVSDNLYGSESRYVSEQRLEAMLDNEWAQFGSRNSTRLAARGLAFSLCGYGLRAKLRRDKRFRTAGSVSGSSRSRAVHPMTFCCTSICAILPTSGSRKPSVSLASILSTPHFMNCRLRDSFLEGLAQDVVRKRVEIDFVELRGPAFTGWDRPHAPGPFGARGTGRGGVLLLSRRRCSSFRGSVQESCCARAGILRPCGSGACADSCANAGRRHPGTSRGVGSAQFRSDWHLLPHGGPTQARRAGAGDPRLNGSY